MRYRFVVCLLCNSFEEGRDVFYCVRVFMVLYMGTLRVRLYHTLYQVCCILLAQAVRFYTNNRDFDCTHGFCQGKYCASVLDELLLFHIFGVSFVGILFVGVLRLAAGGRVSLDAGPALSIVDGRLMMREDMISVKS